MDACRVRTRDASRQRRTDAKSWAVKNVERLRTASCFPAAWGCRRDLASTVRGRPRCRRFKEAVMADSLEGGHLGSAGG